MIGGDVPSRADVNLARFNRELEYAQQPRRRAMSEPADNAAASEAILREHSRPQADQPVLSGWNIRPAPQPTNPNPILSAQRGRAPVQQIPPLQRMDPRHSGPFYPQNQNGWWWQNEEGIEASRFRSTLYHIARIMETDLGMFRNSNNACTSCVAAGHECWTYNERGLREVSRAGNACAECRLRPVDGGCSLVSSKDKRKQRVYKRKPRSPPSGPPRPLFPGPRPPPPAGGSATQPIQVN